MKAVMASAKKGNEIIEHPYKGRTQHLLMSSSILISVIYTTNFGTAKIEGKESKKNAGLFSSVMYKISFVLPSWLTSFIR